MSALVARPFALEAGRMVGVRLVFTGKGKAVPSMVRFLAPIRGHGGELERLSWKAFLKDVVHIHVKILPSHLLELFVFHLELGVHVVSCEACFVRELLIRVSVTADALGKIS